MWKMIHWILCKLGFHEWSEYTDDDGWVRFCQRIGCYKREEVLYPWVKPHGRM